MSDDPVRVVSVPTPAGDARMRWHGPAVAPVTVAMGHGAGAGFASADLVCARTALVMAGCTVVEVEQPWLVAGRRIAPAPSVLDSAWHAVLDALGGPIVVAGRSAGARVACRSADRAVGVLALAFPLRPPGRPDRSRAGELAAVDVPLVVVQGTRDPWGTDLEVAAAAPAAVVSAVSGADHALAGPAAPAVIASACAGLLARLPGMPWAAAALPTT